MAVTRPTAPSRRRSALRTTAVALAATFVVGAAAVAIPAQAASTLKDLATAVVRSAERRRDGAGGRVTAMVVPPR